MPRPRLGALRYRAGTQPDETSSDMYTPFDLSGRGVVVTGGNGGIGLGMARALLGAGAAVAIWGSKLDKTERAKAQLIGHCGDASRVHAFVCDVGDGSFPFQLDPGESVVCSFTRDVVGNPRSETDHVEASWKDEEGQPQPDEPSNDAVVTITNVAPTIAVDKVVTGPGSRQTPGGSFSYRVTIVNQSLVEDVTITDLHDFVDTDGSVNGTGTPGASITMNGLDCAVPFVIAKGGSKVCTFTATVNGPAGKYFDVVVVNGSLGDHGATILAARGDLALEAPVASDCRPLNGLVQAMLHACGDIRCMRDATRGGVATVVNEIAQASGTCVRLVQDKLPVRASVAGIGELLGLDPLYLANEGKLVAIVPPGAADTVLAAMRAHPAGRDSAVIGEIAEGPAGTVTLVTPFGGERIVDMLVGEQLARIC